MAVAVAVEVIRGENETAKLEEEEEVVVIIIIGFFIFMETLLLLLLLLQEMGDGAAAGVVVINGDVVIPIPLFFNDSSENQKRNANMDPREVK